MYKISVPVISETVTKENNRENVYKELKRLDAERVFVSLGCHELDKAKNDQYLKNLKENVAFFKKKGIEVGTWVWTFMFYSDHPFTKMKGIDGSDLSAFACPLDEEFVEFASGKVREYAQSGVDIIMFDDDFRYGFLGPSPACLCKNHVAEICKILGREVSFEEIKYNILNGEKNEIRDAYLAANRKGLLSFAKAMRKAVDSVNPNIRLGACCCMSSWDLDGITSDELARTLAGNTKPFARLIGAPYWAINKSWGNDIHDVVELERMECSWSNTDEIEYFSEGDTGHRPRMNSPASYVESFDTALRASGCTDGILKYGIDYHSFSDYEKGYANFHQKNKELYKKIDDHFSKKQNVGIRVYEYAKKISDANFEEPINISNLFFSNAARTLSNNAIPTVYEGEGVTGIVFGENARHIPLSALKKGLILDTHAAKILTERGVDVGVKVFGEKVNGGNKEYFVSPETPVYVDEVSIYNLELNEKAEVLSTAKDNIPMSYRYENQNGDRFLVINLAWSLLDTRPLRTYARGKQIADNVLWLCGNKLPAYVYGQPSLYMQCKEDDKCLTVGLWNNFSDIALDSVVELSCEYSEISFIQGGGKLVGDKVYLDDIPSFGFCGFTLKK